MYYIPTVHVVLFVGQRKKIGLSRRSDKTRDRQLRKLEEESSSVGFILTTFERKECVRFEVSSASRAGSRETLCRCGRAEREHGEQQLGCGKTLVETRENIFSS